MRSMALPRPVRPASSRRNGIDVARSLALLVVVSGHLMMAVVDRHDGTLRGANLLALRPAWSWIGVAAPMPIFFAAAGWANATSSPATAAARLRTLVGLAAVVVGAWSAVVLLTTLVFGAPGPLGAGARLATQPLWFLAAYLPLAGAGGALGRLAQRRPIGAIAVVVITLATLDVLRFELDGPRWIGWVGFLVAWSVPWLAGAAWRARSTAGGFPEQRVGLALLLGCGMAGALLVAFGGYQPSLIDTVPGARSNSSPPTLYTAVIGLAQVGALMLAARALDRIGGRTRRLWDRLGAASVGIYMWHLTALALCAGAVAFSLPAPERLSVAWWISRPLWFASVLGVAAALVSTTARAQARLTVRSATATTRPRRSSLGIALGAIAAAFTGLVGPSSPAAAAVCTALFCVAWALLRGAPAPRTRVTSSSRPGAPDASGPVSAASSVASRASTTPDPAKGI